MNNICRREKEQGKGLPEVSKGEALPFIAYPPTYGELGNVKFRVDVSKVDKLYVGARMNLRLHRGELVGADGKKQSLHNKRDLAVRTKRIAKRGRYKLGDRFEIRDGEVELQLGGKYKWFTGTMQSRDGAFCWMDTKPRFDEWGRFINERRRVEQYVRRAIDQKYRDAAERKAEHDRLNRHKWALPNGYAEVSMTDAARIYADAMAAKYRGRDDRRIVEAVKGVAESVRSAEDFARLMQLGEAALKRGALQGLRNEARSAAECPGVVTAVERLEKEFYRLDPSEFDYGEGFDRRLKELKATISHVKGVKPYLKLTRDTIAMVSKVRPVSPGLAAKVDALEKQLGECRDDFDEFVKTYGEIRKVRRSVLFSHPAIDFDEILINRNPPTKYSHNSDQHLGRHSRSGPGLTILSGWKTGEVKARRLLEGKLPPGATRNPDLNYDADKLAFAYCDHTQTDANRRRYFLYEAAIDGSWVRQLTGTKRDKFETWDGRCSVIIEDNDPCYLPNGDLIFVSTRSQSFGRCHGGRYNPAWVLHRCDKNGDNIRQISWNNENEYEPAVLNDGRIVFTRWEYTNRHEMLFHMLWWCRPDGTAISHFYGNDTLHPMEVIETTPIPGTHRVVATAQGHHSYNTGTTVVIDTNVGENGEEPLRHITPETPYSESKGWPEPHYSHPFPITEDIFLVSRANHRVHKQGQLPPPADRGIYLIDTLGGRELIYEDPEVASFSPIGIRKRKRPRMAPPMTRPDAPDWGTVFIQNAYLTRNDPEGIIKPGMIKRIRVNALGIQSSNRRATISKDCPNDVPKKVLGSVPVDADGSAVFRVPARTSLQLQILDENGMAILTEKSFFYLQPGESRSCVGCHEPVGASPDMKVLARNSRRTPTELTPPAGPQYIGGLSFMRTVQPVLDRYCIKCHGLEKTEKKVNFIHDGKNNWPSSYLALCARGEHRVGYKPFMGDNGPTKYNVSRPRRFYAYKNKVSHMLLKNHSKVNIDRDSYMRVIEWLDTNAQCYGDMFRNKLEWRRIDGNAMKELRGYAKELFGDKIADQPERALVNVAQPDESRILMAPLAVAGGGWGQMKGWKSKDEAGYKKMAKLVDKCILKSPTDNTKGWQPDLLMGGGEDWVMKEREQFLKELGK
ncbi:MAG: HzsA-related protein [Planctomycetota bacterium]|jgi:hypothetical protein